jgi:hypothetical protein
VARLAASHGHMSASSYVRLDGLPSLLNMFLEPLLVAERRERLLDSPTNNNLDHSAINRTLSGIEIQLRGFLFLYFVSL